MNNQFLRIIESPVLPKESKEMKFDFSVSSLNKTEREK